MLQATNTNQVLPFFEGLVIVGTSGTLGGLVSAIYAMADGGKSGDGKYTAVKGVPVWLFLTARCSVGFGGAIAVLFAALSVNKFTGSSDVDLLSLAALSFVAGTIGHRLLPIVAAQLERQIGDIKQKVEKAQSQAEGAERKAEALEPQISMGREVGAARQYVASDAESPTFTQTIRETLEKFRPQFPLDRGLHFELARLYIKKLRNRGAAVSVLQSFIESKAKAGLTDRDSADAWFNIACYLAIPLPGDDPKTGEGWPEKILSALKTSIEIYPKNAQDALTDKDLESLRELDAFKAIVPQKVA